MSQNDFQARLDRIAAQKPVPAASYVAAEPPQNPPAGSSTGSPWDLGRTLLMIGSLGCFAVGAAIIWMLTSQVTGFYGVMTGSHYLDVDGAVHETAQSASEPNTGPRLPIDALPPAPQGWVRITQKDALGGGLLGMVAQRWPSGGGLLEENSGYRRLQTYAKLYAKEDVEIRVTANRQTNALYLSNSGSYVNFSLIYRSKDRPLGPVADPVSWSETLADEARRKISSGEALEGLTLAGFPAINRVPLAGNNPLQRPLGENRAAATRMQLRVAFTSRALASVSGQASAAELETLLVGVDPRDLP